MQNFIYLIDRESGRVVMLKRHTNGVYSFSFLPRFESMRLARVVLYGVHAGDVMEAITHLSGLVVRVGILAALGRRQQLEDYVAELVLQSGATEISVEA